MSDRNYIAALLIILALYVAGFGAIVLASYHDQPAPASQCQEDMPCWDCETMGNRLCGPGHHN